MMETVRQFIIKYAREEAIARVFSRKDVYAIPEALGLLEGAFKEIDILYGTPKQPAPKSSR